MALSRGGWNGQQERKTPISVRVLWKGTPFPRKSPFLERVGGKGGGTSLLLAEIRKKRGVPFQLRERRTKGGRRGSG